MNCHRIVDFVMVIYYIKDNIPVWPLHYSKLNYDGFFYSQFHNPQRYKAKISFCFVNDVHSIMRRISTLDSRFSAMMGIPVDREIGMCWGVA